MNKFTAELEQRQKNQSQAPTNETISERVRAQKVDAFNETANGREVFEFLMKKFKENTPEDFKKDSMRANLFEQELYNLAHDAVAIRMTENRRGTMDFPDGTSTFAKLPQYFEKKLDKKDIPDTSDTKAYAEFRDAHAAEAEQNKQKAAKVITHSLASSTPSFVVTAHPTELLSESARHTVEKIRDALADSPIERIHIEKARRGGSEPSIEQVVKDPLKADQIRGLMKKIGRAHV